MEIRRAFDRRSIAFQKRRILGHRARFRRKKRDLGRFKVEFYYCFLIKHFFGFIIVRAAAAAAEQRDYEMAQAILDGAGVLVPNGSITDCYDQLGHRYRSHTRRRVKITYLTTFI